MVFLTIAAREMKLGFRNPWSYSFLALFTLFSLALILMQSKNQFIGYTHGTGAMINLVLYLLPLMTLLLGSFSLTSEKEDGGWQLLSTYSLSTPAFVLGKFLGLTTVLVTIVGFGYGLSGLIGVLFGQVMNFRTYLFFVVFSFWLVILFLGIALLIGSFCKNRWQALTVAVGVWFFLIIGWQPMLISVVSFLPYMSVKPAIIGATMVNPAEMVRIFMVTRLGGGTSFGPEYAKWITWLESPLAPIIFIMVCLLILGLYVSIAMWKWERGRKHG